MLTSREKLLLRRLAQGKTDRKIAVEIGGREDQIALQRQRLIERLQIRSEEQLAVLARKFAYWPKQRGDDDLRSGGNPGGPSSVRGRSLQY